MSWTIFTMVYNDYQLLRNFIESVYCNVDPNSWDRLLVLDDFSEIGGRLREYENFLIEHEEKIDVINFPEYRCMNHYMRERGRKPNLGHGSSFNMAIGKMETDYALYLDVDCIFLKSAYDILHDLTKAFEKDSDVMAAGQLFGTKERKTYSEKFNFYHGPAGRDSKAGGYVGPSSGAVRLSGWAEEKIPYFDTSRLPNLFNQVSEGIFHRGGKIYSYPWFTEMKILHLGRGIVRRMSEEDRGLKDTDWFVFCKDFHGRHGPRFGPEDLRSHHYGRGFINMTSAEYREYLKYKGDKPFEIVNPPLDERFVYTVD